MAIGGILTSLLGSAGSNSSLTSNLFNPNLKGAQRHAANIHDPAGIFTGGLGKKRTSFEQGPPISPDIPGFADLRRRVENQQIGFSPEVLERTTSPFIAEREAGFREREQPALEESFGSRGLGRSSLAGREANRAFAQKERDINQILAESELSSIVQGKTDTQNRLNLLRAIGLDENAQRNLAAQDQQLKTLREAGFNVQADIAQSQQSAQSVGVPLSIVSSVLGQGGDNRSFSLEDSQVSKITTEELKDFLARGGADKPKFGSQAGTSRVSGGTFERAVPRDF